MAAFENLRLPALTPADFWPPLARQVGGWLASKGVSPRDAVVLVPFAALLVPARAAFAAAGGWLPRIETPLTLAASLAPPVVPSPEALVGDPVLDRLRASVLLRRQPWALERERQDRRAFAHLVDGLVDAAQALREAALARAPSARAAFFDAARDRLPAPGGPGAFEALLLRVALEWAAEGAVAATDVLFEHRPAAWIALRVGGSDALAEAVLAAAGATPALCVDADADPVAAGAPQRWLCDDLEQAAQAAAAQVIQALEAGRTPVALVALDRQLARRVRALLDRQAVALIDETGWALSTTRAAARLVALLQAAPSDAGPDARLDWLKSWPPAQQRAGALQALEARWRGARRSVDAEAADALWAAAQVHLRPFTARPERMLAGWLALLRERLAADGSLDALRADAAGAQLLQALRLDAPGAGWQAAAGQLALDLAGFAAWVEATLEASQFLPPPVPGAQVVLTPLARAIGRPFGQIVAPGADHRHLGAIEPAPALIGETLADALGLDSAARRRSRQRLAFAQLLRVPALALIRCRRDGDEPLAPSPEVEAQALASAARGAPWAEEREWQPGRRRVAVQPVPRPAPAAAGDLPVRLSASNVEALRDCPYRFFARAVLRLSEADELEAGLEKRDYGTWLHAVLHRFHRDRGGGGDDGAALAAAADAVTLEQQLDAAELLPYRASFESFAPAYLAWLAGRDAAGWRWEAGETDRGVAPPALAPQQLAGRLDRLDRGPDGALQVIDYKTGGLQGLRSRVAEPLEDTQLAFYAALEPAATSATYLALDDPKAPVAVEHERVAESAAALVDGLAGELARLRAGAGLPALGEGRVCETCEARGLCRRDDWADGGADA
jgi:ATP-dependent helicase/nuclease subunit B